MLLERWCYDEDGEEEDEENNPVLDEKNRNSNSRLYFGRVEPGSSHWTEPMEVRISVIKRIQRVMQSSNRSGNKSAKRKRYVRQPYQCINIKRINVNDEESNSNLLLNEDCPSSTAHAEVAKKSKYRLGKRLLLD